MNIKEQAQANLEGAQSMLNMIDSFGQEQFDAGKAEGYASGYAQGKNDGYDEGVKDAQAGNGGDPLKIYTLEDLNQYGAEERAKQAAEDAAVLASVKGELDQRLIEAQNALSEAQAGNQAAIDAAVSAKESELKAQFASELSAVDADNQALKAKYSN